jgi:hypothetical protein
MMGWWASRYPLARQPFKIEGVASSPGVAANVLVENAP